MTPFTQEVSLPHGQVVHTSHSAVAVEAVFKCDNCGRLSIGFGMANGNPNYVDLPSRYEWADGRLRWEPRIGVGRKYPDVPDHIADAASEAHECHSIGADRGAVMLARSVIEATAKSKGITKGQLFDKIEKMHEQGIIREHIKEQAHEVRHLGNDMAHGDFVEPVSAEEADEVLELMAEVLHEVFESHAKLLRRKEARIAKKQGEA